MSLVPIPIPKHPEGSGIPDLPNSFGFAVFFCDWWSVFVLVFQVISGDKKTNNKPKLRENGELTLLCGAIDCLTQKFM